MHEIGIAQEVVDLASEQLLRSGATRAVSITLRVGALSGVIAPALRSAFPAAAAGSAIEGARLIIEQILPAIFCQVCNQEHPIASIQTRRCPVCRTPSHEIIRGAELDLVSLEVE